MESPICVVDAHTFVDHIHDIKSWIYNGQLRLVVPSGLRESVEQLCLKSQEPKAAPKEPKLKALSKPAKKENPTFDANPKIARAYLARIEAGKDFETGSFGRPIYEEEENHAGVSFASDKERYSAWKDVDDHDEPVEPPTDRAESWAEKLRRKQNATNGNPDAKIAKGPVKPKLVAKTGADNSPWKVQKNAPTISGNEVPAALRPMMTFCLWRLHDSVHRNDENQIFVFTDQPLVKGVAQKLNISARSTSDIKKSVAPARSELNLENFGELERDFGVRPVKPRRPVHKNGITSISHVPSLDVQTATTFAEKNDAQAHSGPKSASVTPSQEDEVGGNLGARKSYSETEILPVSSSPPADEIGPKYTSIDLAKSPEPPMQEQVEPTEEATIPSKQDQHPVNKYDTTGIEDVKSSAGNQPPVLASIESLQQPELSTHSKSFVEALLGHQRKAVPSVIAESKIVPPKREATPVKAPSTEAPSPKPEPEGPNIRGGGTMAQKTATASANLHDTPEDSEEEVVVFQPKRLSAQKKPVQQGSTPTTPNFQTQATPTRPQIQDHIQHQQSSSGKRHPSSKLTPKHKHGQKPGNTGNDIRPSIKPPVIDPDAFGRDFAVNTNQNVRGNGRGSLRGGRPRHSPQPSLFDAATGSSRPNSSHRQRRMSPNRVSPKASPKQKLKTPSKPDKQAAIGHQKHMPASASQKPPPMADPRKTPEQTPMPIGTGRPSSIFSTEARTQPAPIAAPVPSLSPPTVPALNANAPIFQPGSLGNSFLSSPLPSLSPPQSTPPKQLPIGSGRPTSKSKLSDQNDTPTMSSTALFQKEENHLLNPSPHIPTGPRQQQSEVPRQSQLPRSSQRNDATQPSPNLGFAEPAPANVKVNGFAPNHPNGTTNSSFRPTSRNRGGASSVRGARPSKPSLFDPELDHTRAYQSDTVEKKGVPSVGEVHYVLKSGSTREQARGRGKLWVG